jgi:hypothetical protein
VTGPSDPILPEPSPPSDRVRTAVIIAAVALTLAIVAIVLALAGL